MKGLVSLKYNYRWTKGAAVVIGVGGVEGVVTRAGVEGFVTRVGVVTRAGVEGVVMTDGVLKFKI